MKYQAREPFRVRTVQGELLLKVGQIVTLPHDKVIELLNKGRITPVEKVVYRIYSEILEAYLRVVETDEDMHALRDRDIKEAIYTLDETKRLKGLSKDTLKELHKVKETFEHSEIKEVKKQS